MADNRREDDPQSEERLQDSIRPAEEVAQKEGDDEIVRSRDQKPNENQTSTQAAMEPHGDLGQKRNTM